jgi:predicted  nucleic acid-binding Zn-ribbon protein
MAETQAKRLERIEEKIDKITDSVVDLQMRAAVAENRTKDLEVRREESYERQNKFSEKLDHVHDCMHDVKAKTELSHKLIWGVGVAIVIGLANEIMTVI